MSRVKAVPTSLLADVRTSHAHDISCPSRAESTRHTGCLTLYIFRVDELESWRWPLWVEQGGREQAAITIPVRYPSSSFMH